MKRTLWLPATLLTVLSISLGLPACLLGAYGYTLLSARWITVLLASFLLLLALASSTLPQA